MTKVHVKVSSMDGHDKIARRGSIEERVFVCLREGS